LLTKVNSAFAKEPLFERINTFGSQVAGETQQKAILAIILSWCAIVLYLGLRFRDFSHGLAAVVALVHDILVTLGFLALAAYLSRLPVIGPLLLLDEFKIDLSVVAAFLTIVGYSVNDTIVIFDRIREIRGRSPFITSDMINRGINQCMSRTILTSLTTLIVEVILYIWGGPGLHAFAFAVMIGTITGTYSTWFIASPVLDAFAGRARAEWEQKRVRYEKAPAGA
jgi:SecD/SecF fusion protein